MQAIRFLMRQSLARRAAGFCLLLSLVTAAQAHPHGHRVIIRERPMYTRVIVRGSPFWYHHGYYYRHYRGRYLLVEPPLGVVVPLLPDGAVSVYFHAVPYYYYGGVYYRQAPGGYVVAQKPDTVYVEKDAPGKTFEEPVSKTVMVANSNGSKTPVRLEQESDGKWKGPRGELYDSFPTDEQLHQAYGF
jgi:hypothetical protein